MKHFRPQGKRTLVQLITIEDDQKALVDYILRKLAEAENQTLMSVNFYDLIITHSLYAWWQEIAIPNYYSPYWKLPPRTEGSNKHL